MCFDFIYNFVWNILRRTERDMIKNWSLCIIIIIIIIMVKFQRKLNYLDGLSKNTEIYYFINIRPLGTELFHADGQTWRS